MVCGWCRYRSKIGVQWVEEWVEVAKVDWSVVLVSEEAWMDREMVVVAKVGAVCWPSINWQLSAPEIRVGGQEVQVVTSSLWRMTWVRQVV